MDFSFLAALGMTGRGAAYSYNSVLHTPVSPAGVRLLILRRCAPQKDSKRTIPAYLTDSEQLPNPVSYTTSDGCMKVEFCGGLI